MSTIAESIVPTQPDADFVESLEFGTEIIKRVREVESGEVELIDHEVVMKEAQLAISQELHSRKS